MPFGIKFSLTVETTVFNSQQLFPSCLLIWGIMQERVYNKTKIANVEELRQRIVDEWERFDQRITPCFKKHPLILLAIS